MTARKTLRFESMYLPDAPLLQAHGVRLALDRHGPDELIGTITLDPNTCRLDAWGDRAPCTRMPTRTREVMGTLAPAQDPRELDRRRWSLQIEDCPELELALIEHPRAGAWYLVIADEARGAAVIPLLTAS